VDLSMRRREKTDHSFTGTDFEDCSLLGCDVAWLL
jgi:hypothetical protein